MKKTMEKQPWFVTVPILMAALAVSVGAALPWQTWRIAAFVLLVINVVATLLYECRWRRLCQPGQLGEIAKLLCRRVWCDDPRDLALAHLQNASSNVQFHKTTQLNLTYYTLLLFGAIVGLSTIWKKCIGVQWLLLVLSFIVLYVSVLLTMKHQDRMRSERMSLHRYNKRLSPNPKDYVDDQRCNIKDDGKLFGDKTAPVANLVAGLIGYFATGAILIARMAPWRRLTSLLR